MSAHPWWKCPTWWPKVAGFRSLSGGAHFVLHVIGEQGGSVVGDVREIRGLVGESAARAKRVNGWVDELLALGVLLRVDGGFRFAESMSESVQARYTSGTDAVQTRYTNGTPTVQPADKLYHQNGANSLASAPQKRVEEKRIEEREEAAVSARSEIARAPEPGPPPTDPGLDEHWQDWLAAVGTLRRAGHPCHLDDAIGREAWERSVRAYPADLDLIAVTAEWVAYWTGPSAKNRRRLLDAVASYHQAMDLALKRQGEDAARTAHKARSIPGTGPATASFAAMAAKVAARKGAPTFSEYAASERREGEHRELTNDLTTALALGSLSMADFDAHLGDSYVSAVNGHVVLVVETAERARQIERTPEVWEALQAAAHEVAGVGARVVGAA